MSHQSLKLEKELIQLVEPNMVSAEEVLNCVEICMDACSVENPLYREGGEEPKYIQPQKLMSNFLEHGWKVLSIAYKRYDDSVNFGHEPTVRYMLVAVMVKVKN